MSVLEKAKELADLIKDSSEVINFKEAEKKLYENSEALENFEKYNSFMYQSESQGLSFDDYSDEEQKSIEQLEQAISSQPEISNYLATEEDLKQLLRSINMIINFGLGE